MVLPKTNSISDADRDGLYDPSFMANLSPALPFLEKKSIKLAVNAGRQWH